MMVSFKKASSIKSGEKDLFDDSFTDSESDRVCTDSESEEALASWQDEDTDSKEEEKQEIGGGGHTQLTLMDYDTLFADQDADKSTAEDDLLVDCSHLGTGHTDYSEGNIQNA